LAGRGSRKSALYEELERRGCVFQARHGFERPGWFEDTQGSQVPKSYDYYGAYEEGAWRLGEEGLEDIPKHAEHKYNELIEGELTFSWPTSHKTVTEECRAAREGVAIFDQSYFGKFFLRGVEADKAIQYLCGADMEGKQPGSVTYTPLCNIRGGVEADLTVTKLLEDGESYYYIAAGGNTCTKDLAWIRGVLDDGNFKAFVEDRSEEMTLISVQGPHSRSLLETVITCGTSLQDDAFPFSAARHLEVAGHRCLALRLTFVGELGFELHVPATCAVDIYRAVRQAGDKLSADGISVRDAGYRAIDSLSAEKNFRHWHADLSNRDTPMEAGIGFTVLSKLKRTGEDAPDFLGRAALEAHRAKGLQRKIVCLVLEQGDEPLHGAETIWRDGCCIGYVRSTAYGHTLGRSIAYGYVDCPESEAKITNAWLQAGQWQVGDKGQKHNASLSLKAPFDPSNERVKGNYPA